MNKKMPREPGLPRTRSELHDWIRERLHSLSPREQALLDAMDNLLLHHERLWQQSKQEAIEVVSAGFTERMKRLRSELAARDATVSSITRYFQELVADLTDRVHRDPKTGLIHSRRFTEQLEAFLALEQRGVWCAVGLVDITAFKSYNDTLGHAVGDKILECVANLLREQVRAGDMIAHGVSDGDDAQELHARFGGDEFCFLIPRLDDVIAAGRIAERFRTAVEHHEWSAEDARLATRPVTTDIGVVCLRLGAVSERRPVAPQLAQELLRRADQQMYEAKRQRITHIDPVLVRLAEHGRLVDCSAEARG